MSHPGLPHQPQPDPPPAERASLSAPAADEVIRTAESARAAIEDAQRAQLPRRRRVGLPLTLFLATCASTFLAGASHWHPYDYLAGHRPLAELVQNPEHLRAGLAYMGAVLGILLLHEMGHFLQTVRYRVAASLPYFLPIPFIPLGTMGAVIGMDGLKADRKQLFDIGISGPLAGLVLAIPITYLGIVTAVPAETAVPGELMLDPPLVMRWMINWAGVEIPPGGGLAMNPLLVAGWVGLLITGLNMLPISQLDGGHVVYGLFGPNSRLIARGFLVVAMLYVVFGSPIWTPMLILVILLGTDHPRTANDSVRLGPMRWLIGATSLAIPILCFPLGGVRVMM